MDRAAAYLTGTTTPSRASSGINRAEGTPRKVVCGGKSGAPVALRGVKRASNDDPTHGIKSQLQHDCTQSCHARPQPAQESEK